MSLTLTVPAFVPVDERRAVASEASVLVSMPMAALTLTMRADSSGTDVTVLAARSVDAGLGRGACRSLCGKMQLCELVLVRAADAPL